MSYPSEQERSVISAAEKLMVETMARYDPSHDAYHVQRVRKTALSLAHAVSKPSQTPSATPDLLTIELAALLHDILDKKYVSSEQAADPYGFFLPYFETWCEATSSPHGPKLDLIADGRAATIARIVDNVSWSTEKRLRSEGQWTEWHDTCVELHCVQDADRLDAIGAFGIMRCAAFSAATHQALHAPAGDLNQPKSAVQHFHDKLVHIHEHLKTAPGRKLGERRHQLILDFVKAVDEEVDVDTNL